MSNHKTFEYTNPGDEQVRRTSSSRWAEELDTPTNLVVEQMARLVFPVTMLDEPVHTDEAPVCDDSTCPCHDEQETVWVSMPDGTQRIPSQVNDEALNTLSRMSAAYAEQQRGWEAMSIDERRAWLDARG